MLSPRARKPKPTPPVSLSTTTPVLLNTVFTRLRALGKGLQHACGEKTVSGLLNWMDSYGSRLDTMATHLQDEGAKNRPSSANSAQTMFLKESCADPITLLKVIQVIQLAVIEDYAQLSIRLDMDEELYELIHDQEVELRDVYDDIEDLRMEYEAYGNP